MTYDSLTIARRSDYRVVIEFVRGDPAAFRAHRYAWAIRDTSDASVFSGTSDDPEEAATCALLAWIQVVEGVVEREMAAANDEEKRKHA